MLSLKNLKSKSISIVNAVWKHVVFIFICFIIGEKDLLALVLFMYSIPIGLIALFWFSFKIDNRMPGVHFGRNIG